METLGASMDSKNTLKLIQDGTGRASILRIPFYTLGCNRIRINDNICDLTPEIYKKLSSTFHTGKTMKIYIDNSMMSNIMKDFGYTGIGDRIRKEKHFQQ